MVDLLANEGYFMWRTQTLSPALRSCDPLDCAEWVEPESDRHPYGAIPSGVTISLFPRVRSS